MRRTRRLLRAPVFWCSIVIDRRCHGFTLIELLVALAIFAVLAVLGTRTLLSILDTRTQVEAQAKRWQAIDSLFATIETDLLSARAAPLAASAVDAISFTNDRFALIVSTSAAPIPPAAAWREPTAATVTNAASAAPSNGFRAIEYRLQAVDQASTSVPRTLVRRSRAVLSNGEASASLAVREESFGVVLRQWQVRYFDQQGAWQIALPAPTPTTAGANALPAVLPTGIEVTLWLEDDAALARPLRRVFLLPGLP